MQTNLPVFRVKESSVRRRFSDFEWLRNELERDSKIVVPALPSKAIKRQLPFRGDDGDSTHCHCECIFTSLCRDIWGGLHRGTPGRSGGFHQQDCRTPACTERALPSHVSPGGTIFPHFFYSCFPFLIIIKISLIWTTKFNRRRTLTKPTCLERSETPETETWNPFCLDKSSDQQWVLVTKHW